MSGSGLFISCFRQRIGPLFVDDLGVTTEVARVAPICAGYQIFDGIAGTSSGVLRYLEVSHCTNTSMMALTASKQCMLLYMVLLVHTPRTALEGQADLLVGMRRLQSVTEACPA